MELTPASLISSVFLTNGCYQAGNGLSVTGQLERRSKKQRCGDVRNGPEGQVSSPTQQLRHEARRPAQAPRQFRSRHTAILQSSGQLFGHVQNQPFLTQQPFVRLTMVPPRIRPSSRTSPTFSGLCHVLRQNPCRPIEIGRAVFVLLLPEAVSHEEPATGSECAQKPELDPPKNPYGILGARPRQPGPGGRAGARK